MNHQESSRNPRGLATRKPISLRLMPEELEHADVLANELNVTKSKLARTAYLAGLPTAIEKLSPAAATSSPTPIAAGFSSGEASASAAGLSTTAA